MTTSSTHVLVSARSTSAPGPIFRAHPAGTPCRVLVAAVLSEAQHCLDHLGTDHLLVQLIEDEEVDRHTFALNLP